jgi:hypothetical protein
LAPGTTWALLCIAVTVPLGAGACIILWRNKRARAFFAALRVSPEARAAFRGIKRLAKAAPRMNGSECAREASALARTYLASRLAAPYRAFTPGEAAQAMQSSPWGKGGAQTVEAIFSRCDVVRFCPARFPPEERLAMLEEIRGLVRAIESEAAHA